MAMALEIPQIIDLASAFYGSSVLFAALDCDLFTVIKETPEATVDALVKQTGLSKRGLTLLLDAAVAIGLLTKAQGVYSLTPATASTLVKDAPHDLTRAIAYNRDVYQAWGKLTQFVQTGMPVEAPQLHLGDDAMRTRRFALSMYARAMAIGQAVVPHLHLPKGVKVLDLAGGPGAYACLMAKADPTLTCDTYDLPAIAEIAKELTAPYADRVTCHAGDYHTDVWTPQAYDVVTLFGCLHQESPEMIVDILKRAYAALRPGGVVYVLDLMTGEDHTTPPFAALFAVNMALTTEHGWVFSDKELATWCAEAGFTDFTVAPVPPPMPHMLARAVKA
jgi:SAM-dependent methyltransferase